MRYLFKKFFVEKEFRRWASVLVWPGYLISMILVGYGSYLGVNEFDKLVRERSRWRRLLGSLCYVIRDSQGKDVKRIHGPVEMITLNEGEELQGYLLLEDKNAKVDWNYQGTFNQYGAPVGPETPKFEFPKGTSPSETEKSIRKASSDFFDQQSVK